MQDINAHTNITVMASRYISIKSDGEKDQNFPTKKKNFMQSDIIKNTRCILTHTCTHTRRSCWLRELGELRKGAILVGNVV